MVAQSKERRQRSRRWKDSRTGAAFTAALLFNKYDGDLEWELLKLIRNAASTVTNWPSHDFTRHYF